MKRILIFFISLFTAISLQARETVYPQVQTVINKLFSTYDVPETRAESNLHFAKKPEGWFVQWTDQTKIPEAVVSEELFWSAKKGAFVKLAKMKPGKTSIAEGMKNSFYSYGEKYSYSRIPYWGYIGWDKDVIRYFAGKAALTDTLLEGLARAYMNYAYGFTDHNYGYHNPVSGLNEKAKLDSFIFYSRLDIATMDRLRRQNPNYEMLAGNSMVKYSGDIMAFFDYLQLSGNEKFADVYFNEELFTPVILASAKYMLAACAMDAILFTNGDNDTYPLEYLQHVRGFRTDVTIINLSMLNLYSTIEQASKGKGKAKPVKFSYPMERYADDASEYFREENLEPEDISYEKFISKSYKQNPDYGGSYYNYPQCTIEFSADTSLFPEFPEAQTVITPRLQINKAYFLRSDFAQLDILMSNAKRPIYYTITIGDYGLAIQDYLFGEGIIDRFIPLKMINGNLQSSFGRNMVTGITYDNLMSIGFQSFPAIDKTTDERFILNFRLQFLGLADILQEEDPAKTVKLLDRCDSLFPSEVWNYDAVWAYGIKAYYTAGQFTSGDRVAMKILDQFEKALSSKIKPDEQDISNMILAASMIEAEASRHQRNEVAARAKKFTEKYKPE